jgi:hypothetical protein
MHSKIDLSYQIACYSTSHATQATQALYEFLVINSILKYKTA